MPYECAHLCTHQTAEQRCRNACGGCGKALWQSDTLTERRPRDSALGCHTAAHHAPGMLQSTHVFWYLPAVAMPCALLSKSPTVCASLCCSMLEHFACRHYDNYMFM